MENRFTNRDFEHFVKGNADQYRMFASEKVWKGINNTLHTRRRWYGIGLALLLLTTGAVTWVMLQGPGGDKQLLADMPISSISRSISTPTIKTEPAILVANDQEQERLVTTSVDLHRNPFIATVNSVPQIEEGAYADLVPFVVSRNNKVNSAPVGYLPASMIGSADVQQNSSPAANRDIQKKKKSTPSEPIASATRKSANNRLPVTYIDDNFTEESSSKKPAEETALAELKQNLPPFTIESVVNSYAIRISKKRKRSLELYFTPTVSYRKLSENKKLILNSQPINAPYNFAVTDDINNVVKHKPDIGLELGINAGFPIGKNIKLITGFQLNVSKYDIKAYPFMLEEARVVLNNSNGMRSVSTAETNYRATESFTKPHWLSNFYVSASLPIGLEAQLAGTRKTYFGIGATIQPTYVIADRAYVLSTDFKNYANIPSLTRRTNVNSSFELFAAHTTGRTTWRIGPQIRYQLLSSFKKQYPVKEHLINYGLKLGIMLK